jgi:hemoglobin-like flavoprotein
MPDYVEQARNSLSRCLGNPAFLDRFYNLFMTSSEDIRKKFEGTDFDRQKKMLQDSLFLMMVSAGATSGVSRRELSKLGDRHSRNQRDIKPEWYDVWLECLMKAVAENDPEFVPAIETAWRESLKSGIDFLKSKY